MGTTRVSKKLPPFRGKHSNCEGHATVQPTVFCCCPKSVPVCPKPLSVLLFEGIVSALFALGFLYLTIRLFTENSVGSVLSTSSFSFGPFLLVVSIVATWQITYGPYVADYSRYLPHDTPISSSFWWTYTGSVLSSIWMMAFGSIAVAVVGAEFANNSVRYVWNRQDSDSAS
jgi:purine-cytosine permease-like protein